MTPPAALRTRGSKASPVDASRPLSLKKMRPYQIEILEYCLKRKLVALFVDMRLGKTLIIIRWLLSISEIKRVLIVSSYSALEGWEIALKEEGIQNIAYLIGEKSKRLNALWSKAQFNLLNKEGWQVIEDIKYVDWDAIIIDESTFIKSPDAKVTEFYLKNFKQVPYKAILSGTPAPESELEYFCQLKFLSPDILSESIYYAWRHNNFTPASDGSRWFIHSEGRKRLARALHKHCHFLARKDVNLGGEKIHRLAKVELSSKARKTYDEVERSFVLEIDGQEVDKTLYATTAFIWLRRICGGLVEGKLIQLAKMRALIDLLTGELRNEQVIIWAVFIDEILAIHSELTRNKISSAVICGQVKPQERNEMRKQFFDGALRTIICQPECFRHGVDLSCAATMIYYSSPCGLETRQQTEDRFVDVSKTDSLLIIDLVIENSVDEDIVKSLRRKEKRNMQLKAIINGMHNRANN
jgi:SNF2 family DNA or RNA helicase